MTLRGDCVAKKLNLVDMYGIGVMLEYLVAEDNLRNGIESYCELRGKTILPNICFRILPVMEEVSKRC